MSLLAPNRRVVLRDGTLFTLGLCLGCSGAPPTEKSDSASIDAAAPDSAAPEGVEVCGDEAQPGAGGWQVVPLERLPEPGTGVALEIAGRQVVLARPDEACAVVVSRACTHQGCDVGFTDGRFVCPCHGAAFRLDGSVIAGPTSVPLTRYPAELRDEVLWVDIS